MANLVPLEEAAKLLGLTTEQLNAMRTRNEMFGIRDGNTWKFRMDEIQRVAEAKGINLDLGDSSSAEMFSDSDSAHVIVDEEELEFGSSDIKLAAEESGNVLADEEVGQGESPSDTGKMSVEALGLSEDDLFEDELTIQDSGTLGEADLSSDFEDSDLVLDDSDSSDEVTMESAKTGVNLSPTDSGISLDEEPLELGGSDIDSLELPEDDDIISLEEAADPDSATELKSSDDDFNLTPLEDSLDEDSSSGSQVIALEDSGIYTDDSAPTMLSDSEDMGQPLVAEDSAATMVGAPSGAATLASVHVLPEAPYTIGQIIALVIVLVTVGMGAMVAFDLARNIWQPEGTTLSNTVLNFFINLGGFKSS